MAELGAEAQALLDRLSALAASPPEAATPLPPALYHSDEILALEQARIFARDWLSPGLAAEIPRPGDYLTFSIGAQPIFCIRGNDGVIRSFANVCRHRLMRLVEGRGNCRRISCPYHAWTYELDGRLAAAPHMDRTPGFERSGFGLRALNTEVWQGWIYVTLDPDAAPLSAALEPLLPVVERYRMAGYRPILQQDHLWDTNWKILTENFMEGYHLPIAHRKTVGAWFPAEDTGFPERAFEAFTYQTFSKTEDAAYGVAHPDNARLEGRWRHTSVLPTIFPSHMYVLAPDHLWYLSLRPEGVGRVQVRFGVALAPEAHDGLEDLEGYVAETEAFFARVNGEDRAVVEAIFGNVRAPLAEPGRLCWLERELHDFMGYLARRLTMERTPEQPALREDEA